MKSSQKRIFNFSAGPAILPQYVLDRTAEDIYDFRGTGIGILETSHRSTEFADVISETEGLFRELLAIPKNYKILFTTGGGTNQFSMIPMNLLRANEEANYLLSGFWSERAFNEAKKFGAVHIAGSTKDSGYTSISTTVALSANPAYLHFTSNNTIYGSQWKRNPECPENVPLICDASSDILSQPLDIGRYGAVYAAAQKNAGTAGVTIIILREDLLSRSSENLPVMMSYKNYAENNSLYNTAPTFPIYVTMRTLEWIKQEGGVAVMKKRAEERGKLLYDCIDRHEAFTGIIDAKDRSLMNITFRLKSESLTEEFIKLASDRGLTGIAGYRAVGGLRVSLYNAFPIEGVRELVGFMDEFAGRL